MQYALNTNALQYMTPCNVKWLLILPRRIDNLAAPLSTHIVLLFQTNKIEAKLQPQHSNQHKLIGCYVASGKWQRPKANKRLVKNVQNLASQKKSSIFLRSWKTKLVLKHYTRLLFFRWPEIGLPILSISCRRMFANTLAVS